MFFNLTVFFLSHELIQGECSHRPHAGKSQWSILSSNFRAEPALQTVRGPTSLEKTSRDENGAACEPPERSDEGFPLLETSPRGYPRWTKHSPPSTVLQHCSSRTCLMKFPSQNLQESQSLPEQGTNFSAPTVDEPQRHEVVLALHLCNRS